MTEVRPESNLEKNEMNTATPAVAILVKVIQGQSRENEKRFTGTFQVGRSKECDLQILETCVSRVHLQVILENGEWRLKDLESANGTFMDGAGISEALLPDNAMIELGKGGVSLSLTVERRALPKVEEKKAEEPQTATKDFGTETQIIRHYFDKKTDENIGEQTMMFRRAFERVHKKKSVKYQIVIGVVILLLMATGAAAVYQNNRLNKMRTASSNIFYTMKSIELQVSKLEEVVLLKADPVQVAELKAKRDKLKDMEKEYDIFVKELGTYKNASEDEKIILHVARIFGECDANAPKGFVDEVRRYIEIWKKTDRLKIALNRARENGYAVLIPKILKNNDLPSEYFFLALQESNFEERAVGPQTRFGFAKGMWQFIPVTASQYGLKNGPLADQGAYDQFDDRFDFVKSTGAASRYIKDISNSQAQASGLLVMASYNWGEGNVRQIIAKMPENPKDRNFWRLLQYKDIPRETYDYVFSIVSAAAICENPKLFGFDVECPVLRTQPNSAEARK
jgi:membrane-bound lytic murein transglycosylase D